MTSRPGKSDKGEPVSEPTPDMIPPPPPALELEVRGRPVPKGAVTAFVVPGKSGKRARAVVAQGGSKARRSALNEWQSAIQDAALVASGSRELEVARFVGMAVAVEITFRLGRPKAHYGTGKNAGKLKPDAPAFPIGTPDVDKLARAALDALIGSAFDDDSRVVDLHPRKVYAAAGEAEGARIVIRAAAERPLAPVLSLVPPAMTASELRLLESNEPPADFVFRDPDPSACVQGVELRLLEQLELPAREQLELPVVAPEDRKARARERIKRSIAGSQMDGELRAMGHALERHTPPAPMIDSDVAAAINAGDREYRLRVLGQCDGDHPAPACASAHCWHRDPIDVAIAAGDRLELARRMLAAPSGSDEERRCLAALATNVRPADAGHFACKPDETPPPSDHPDDVDDFGGPDL